MRFNFILLTGLFTLIYYFCPMLNQLQDYIEQHELFKPADPILLAVSGGVDSMVMAELILPWHIVTLDYAERNQIRTKHLLLQWLMPIK